MHASWFGKVVGMIVKGKGALGTVGPMVGGGVIAADVVVAVPGCGNMKFEEVAWEGSVLFLNFIFRMRVEKKNGRYIS